MSVKCPQCRSVPTDDDPFYLNTTIEATRCATLYANGEAYTDDYQFGGYVRTPDVTCPHCGHSWHIRWATERGLTHNDGDSSTRP